MRDGSKGSTGTLSLLVGSAKIDRRYRKLDIPAGPKQAALDRRRRTDSLSDTVIGVDS